MVADIVKDGVLSLNEIEGSSSVLAQRRPQGMDLRTALRTSRSDASRMLSAFDVSPEACHSTVGRRGQRLWWRDHQGAPIGHLSEQELFVWDMVANMLLVDAQMGTAHPDYVLLGEPIAAGKLGYTI